MAEYLRYPYGICFTLNNYTAPMVEAASNAVGQRGINYICWGYETAPTTGTPHMQGYLQSTQKNFARLQKVFGGGKPRFTAANAESGPREVEPFDNGKGKMVYTAIGYCKKGGDFVEFGTPKPIPAVVKGQRSDLESLKHAIDEGQSFDEICETHFAEAAKYGRFIKDRIAAKQREAGKASLLAEYEGVSWKPWQQQILDTVELPPPKRTIQWVWEGRGNVGKSFLATYLMLTKNALVLEPAKKADLIHIFSKHPTKIVLIDLSRTNKATEDQRKHFLDGMYSLAEQLKNGRMISPKYDGEPLIFPTPHVIFFANFEPDMSKWSADRYDILEL